MTIGISDSNKIRTVRLQRPEKRNALTDEMYNAFSDALDGAAKSDKIGVVLISAEGSFFCAGNDISAFSKVSQTSALALAPSPAVRFVKTISGFKKPLIAAVNGPGVGVGATMLLHCDLVIAQRAVWFTFPFVDLGLVPEAGSSLLLPKRMGHAAAARLLLLGDRLTADEGHAAGLVSHISDGDAEPIAAGCAEQLTKLSPFSLVETKRLMRNAHSGLEEQMREEGKAFSEALRSDFARDRFAAFLNRARN